MTIWYQRGPLYAGLVRFPPGESSQPWTVPPDFWNLSYTLGGTVHERLPGGDCRQGPGDLMILKPGGSHRWEVPADAPAPWHVVYFVFVPSPAWQTLLADLPEEFPHFTRLSLAGRPADRRVRVALLQAHRLAGLGADGRALALNAIERALLWLRADHAADRAGDDPRVRAAMDLFARRLANPPTIPEAAAACGLSASRLRECFLARTGVTPGVWQERVRLNHARDLLLTTGVPVKVIAAACGYRDQRYFATRFRRVFGHSPTACRAAPRPPGL